MELINFYATHSNAFIFSVAVISVFIGSFLNVVIYRLPKMLETEWASECRRYLGLRDVEPNKTVNLVLPFSHCIHCKKTIMPWHNLPILSYLYLRGHCAYCHAPISFIYPLVELLTLILSCIVANQFGFSSQTAAALIITWVLICLTFIDIEHFLLPDQLTLTLLWFGLLISLGNIFCSPQDAIIGAVVGYLLFATIQWIFYFLTKKIGMGQGDYKLLAALGGLLGWQHLPFVILCASITGIVITLLLICFKPNVRHAPLPFGPYLAFAGWVALLWGQPIMQIYWNNML